MSQTGHHETSRPPSALMLTSRNRTILEPLQSINTTRRSTGVVGDCLRDPGCNTLMRMPMPFFDEYIWEVSIPRQSPYALKYRLTVGIDL